MCVVEGITGFSPREDVGGDGTCNKIPIDLSFLMK